MAKKECTTSLNRGILNDCNESYGIGLEQIGWIINRDYVDFTAVTYANKYTMSKLAAIAGKYGHRVYTPAKNAFEGVTTTLVSFGPGLTAYDKTVPLLLLADSPRNAQSVDELRSGSYIVILENRAKGLKDGEGAYGDQAFPMYGVEQGLRIETATLEKYSEDSNGGWKLEMKEEKASTSNIFLFSGDYETTKAMLNALLEPAA